MAAGLVVGLILAIILVLFFTSPTLPNVTLISVNVSRLNFTSDDISGYVDMQFQVRNTNVMTDFSYDNVNCSVYHGKQHLASTMFPRFVQRASETKQINFTVYLKPVATARENRSGFAPYSFDVELTTLIDWQYGSMSVKVSCNEVPVGLLLSTGGHGKMIGPARTCTVF